MLEIQYSNGYEKSAVQPAVAVGERGKEDQARTKASMTRPQHLRSHHMLVVTNMALQWPCFALVLMRCLSACCSPPSCSLSIIRARQRCCAGHRTLCAWGFASVGHVQHLAHSIRHPVNVWLHKSREEGRKSELIIVWVTPAHEKEVHRSIV